MLNINVNLDIRKTTYPIISNNNTCTACGGVGTLKFVDIFGRQVSQEIHALEKIQCNKCGAKYGIQWDSNDKGEMVPTPTDYDASVMFNNLLNYSRIKKHGTNIL